MITEDSIQEVRDRSEILEVVRKHVDLKKRGADHVGPCPFHEEKTGSFHVSVSKGIYKCFGCGAGGDAIKFLMVKERLPFFDAVRALAGQFNITLEEKPGNEEDKEQAEKKADLYSINNIALKKYMEKLLSELKAENSKIREELLINRALNMDTIVEFQLGYAPDEWRYIATPLIDKALYHSALELGLVNTSNGSNYDVYRNRIMFPIHDERGQVIGFGGRKLEDENKDNPKYINSKESKIYKKDRVLYGLYHAQKEIRKAGFAVVVEGYYDVISFHQGGVTNTVAPCGTALTDGHAKLLKKYTTHVILMGDGDEAGMKANLKAVDILLKHGFKVEVCTVEEGKDPDSLARELAQASQTDDENIQQLSSEEKEVEQMKDEEVEI